MVARQDVHEQWLAVAIAIADGRPVDWNSLPVDNPDEAPAEISSSLAARLRALERLVRGHEAVRPDTSADDAHGTILPVAAREKARSASQPLQVQWGPLVVIEKIGRGSFGDVYRAWDPRLDREVALKLIPEAGLDTDVSPVVEEGRLLARVRHPNVLTVYGAERIDGRIGIWTELIDGETLAAEVLRRGALQPEEAVRIGVDVCRALEAVHRAGLLHRDVKAQNIFRDSDGRLVLGDFGTGVETNEKAPVTEPRVAGTPLYMAPEVIAHQPPTVGSDLYSVGVLLYFLVTGTYPVRGRTLEEIRRHHEEGTMTPLRARRPDAPDAFADIVDRLLASPDRRYGSAAAVTTALEACVAADPFPGRTATSRRLSLAAGIALLVASAMVLNGWRARGPTPAVLPLNAGDWIVVADFENTTGEDVLDAMASVFKRELEYSEYVRAAQPSRIEDSLRLLERSLDSRLDPSLARQVALRDGGIRVLVAGNIRTAGPSYVISVDIVNPLDGTTVGQLSEQATRVSDIPAAVRRAALTLRERIGEPAESVARSQQALQRMPPPPLTAMRSYAQGAATAHSISSTLPSNGVPYRGPQWIVVERLARDAVEADPTFARAWILLSDAIGKQRRGGDNSSAAQMRLAEQRAHEEKAFQLIARATPRERYAIERMLHGGRAYQHWTHGNLERERRELELSLAARQALLALQPDDDEASESALQGLRDLLGPEFYREIMLMTIQAADARPTNVALNLEVANIYLSQFRLDAARIYIARAESAMAAATPAQAATIRLLPAAIAWLQDDSTEAMRIADRVARTASDLGNEERREVSRRLLSVYFALGRVGKAEGIINGFPNLGARAQFFSNIGDKARLEQVVAAWPESPPPGDGVVLIGRIRFFIETGRLEAAERELEALERLTTAQGSRGFRGIYLDHQGALELARGRSERAIELLGQSIAIKTKHLPGLASLNGHYTIAQLASALETVGQFDQAIALLAGAGDRRGEVAAFGTFDSWMLNRARLARLYRKTGNVGKAEGVEAHLLKLLALAEPNFPLLRELRARSN